MSDKRVTIKDLESIIAKNCPSVSLEKWGGKVQFIDDKGTKLSSKLMTIKEAYDWLWAFIEGIRFQDRKQAIYIWSSNFGDGSEHIIVQAEDYEKAYRKAKEHIEGMQYNKAHFMYILQNETHSIYSTDDDFIVLT